MESKIFLKEMGVRICQQRKNKHLTQEELAEMIDVSTQMISNLETGKKAVRPENLSKICSALEISADYILTGTERIVSQDPVYQKIASLTDRERSILSELIAYMYDK